MDKSKGYIHIYHGDGKGKTTAGVGLALRALGHDLPVVYAQFLKDGQSGELTMLRRLAEAGSPVAFFLSDHRGFTQRLTPDQRQTLAAQQQELLGAAFMRCVASGTRLLVLDEVLHAVNMGFVELETLCLLLDNRPPWLEVVLTGRDPHPALVERAHYITEMKKQRHPYDQGLPARVGVER